MPESDDDSQEALKRLQERLDALSAKEASKVSVEAAAQSSVSEAYRLLGEVIGAILAGVGLGLVADRFLHTTPLLTVAGVLAGTAVSGYVAVKSADRFGAGKSGGKETTKR